MKKLIIMFTVLVVFLSLFLLLLNNYKDKPYEENTFAIKSYYSYLIEDKITIPLKLYSNIDRSLLLYSDKASARLHDKSEDNILSVSIVESKITNNLYYNEEQYYEYTLLVELSIDSLLIEDCYLTLEFPKKTYTFNIGLIDIEEKKTSYKPINITNLYGVTKGDNLSLAGYVITFNNTTNFTWNITDIMMGSNNKIILNNDNVVDVKESNDIADYDYIDVHDKSGLTVTSNSSKTYILPVKTERNLYLFNSYLLIEINNEIYYISNFNYINSNDIIRIEKYLERGIIYEF